MACVWRSLALVCITVQIKPLEEDKAVAAGGNLLAEGFVYSLGASLSE